MNDGAPTQIDELIDTLGEDAVVTYLGQRWGSDGFEDTLGNLRDALAEAGYSDHGTSIVRLADVGSPVLVESDTGDVILRLGGLHHADVRWSDAGLCAESCLR